MADCVQTLMLKTPHFKTRGGKRRHAGRVDRRALTLQWGGVGGCRGDGDAGQSVGCISADKVRGGGGGVQRGAS